jgi:hypothetical protein
MRRAHPHLGTRLWILGALAAARVALADPALQPDACGASSPEEARSVAERLFESGAYQRAGECYQAAGDLAHANLAFLKAVGPKSDDTTQTLKTQRDAAKSLVARYQQALHRTH